jgi:hypothetical protein
MSFLHVLETPIKPKPHSRGGDSLLENTIKTLFIGRTSKSSPPLEGIKFNCCKVSWFSIIEMRTTRRIKFPVILRHTVGAFTEKKKKEKGDSSFKYVEVTGTGWHDRWRGKVPLRIFVNYIHIPVLVAVLSVVFPLKTQMGITTKWTWLILPIPIVQILTTLFRWVVFKEYTTTLASFPYAVTETLVALRLDDILSSSFWTYILIPTIAEILFTLIVWCCACRRSPAPTDEYETSFTKSKPTTFGCLCASDEYICVLKNIQKIIPRSLGKILHLVPFYLALFVALKLDDFLSISWFQMIGIPALVQIGLCIVLITIQDLAFFSDSFIDDFKGDLTAYEEAERGTNPDASTFVLELLIRSPLLTTSISILAISELGLALYLDGVLDWNRFWLFVPAYLSVLLFMIYVICRIISSYV